MYYDLEHPLITEANRTGYPWEGYPMPPVYRVRRGKIQNASLEIKLKEEEHYHVKAEADKTGAI